MFAEANPLISGWGATGRVAVPPGYSAGTCAMYPGSVACAVDTTGIVTPHQLLLKFLRFVVPGAGTGVAPRLGSWRSSTWPYQLSLMSLNEKTELSAWFGGVFEPRVPIRNRTPTVQLFVMK